MSKPFEPASFDGASGRGRAIAFAACALFSLLPLLAVRLPPVMDLPQQFHQVVLAQRALRGLEPDLVVTIFGPNRLGYLPLAAGWLVGGASQGPRIAVALVALFWVGTIHLFAWRKQIGVASTVLASLFIFNRSLYVGLFNFLFGLGGILLWIRELDRDPARSSVPRLAAGAFAASLLLYLSHVFWFIAGTALAGSFLLLRRFDRRQVLARALGVLPVILLMLRWSGSFGGFGWQTNIASLHTPLERISSLVGFADLVLGGIRSPAEELVVLICLGYLGLGAARLLSRSRDASVHVVLLVAGVLCLLGAVLLPEKVDRLACFNSRWAPFAMVFLLLALPPPAARRGLVAGLAFAAFAALSVATTATWLRFEREELPGFAGAVAAVPEGSRLLALDYAPKSPYLQANPTQHLAAYAGVEKNARLSQSFTLFQSSLAVLRNPESPPSWQLSPDWSPYEVRPSVLAEYDVALIHGAAELVARVLSFAPRARLVASEGRWALLDLDPASP